MPVHQLPEFFRLPLILLLSAFLIQTIQSQQLPQISLRSRFRIQVFESESGILDSLKQRTSDVSVEFKMSAYLVQKKDCFKILMGDFTARDNAKNKLARIRKTFKTAKVMTDQNEYVVYFDIYEKKKEIKPPKGEQEISDFESSDSPVINFDTRMKPGNYESFEMWNDKKYLVANTASNEDYLTEQEKNVYYYLNICRMNPKLFADTYLLKHADSLDDEYEISLYKDLQKMESLPCLQPNKQCWESAKCHAIASGESSYVGHDRENCVSYFWGECCQYGPSDPLAIVLQLLIDRGVPSLGHRSICMGSYDELGVSIQPHIGYGSNAVLDFR
jgi:hypothetical protein